MALLRNLNRSNGGRRVLGAPYLGLAVSSLPLGATPPCLLENDVLPGDAVGTLYAVRIKSWPTAGSLFVYPNSSLTFSGAPDGTYTGTQEVRKYHPTNGLITAEITTYTIVVGTGGSTGPTPDARYARPASDVSAGGWVPSSGTALYAMLNEASPDASDFIATTTASSCEVALNPVLDPGTSSGQVVSYQVWSTSGSGITVQLKQGGVVIASWTHSSLPASPTTYAQALTAAQCDAITDYTNLRFAFIAL
jgi:hypothetical protein